MVKSTGLVLLALFVVSVTTAFHSARQDIGSTSAPLAESPQPEAQAERRVVAPAPVTVTVTRPRVERAPTPSASTAARAPEPPRPPTAPAATASRRSSTTSSRSSRPTVRVPETSASVRARASASSVPEVSTVQEAPRSSRWRRSRSRNRYSGRIPTPSDWEAPEGPVRIALQAGHWRANEAPWELSGLRNNGTQWQGTPEWEVNLEIAELAADMLREYGYEVDVLPAVVPPGYRAHLFIAIHADGAEDPNASGYRVAAPRRDATGRAGQVVEILRDTYGEETGIRELSTVTRRMQNYYAFNFRRYEHALHPMTIAIILETGFVTSARDREVIFDAPERAARGIVEAVREFPVTADPAGYEDRRGR